MEWYTSESEMSEECSKKDKKKQKLEFRPSVLPESLPSMSVDSGMVKVDDKLVALNVSGKHMLVKRSVLTKYKESMLAAMFSGRHSNTKDGKGRVYIGRPSKPFVIIISWLQTGIWIKPSDPYLARAVMVELDYFGLREYFVTSLRQTNQFMKSKILNTEQLQDAMLQLCPEKERLWRLIYRGTDDGFGATTFHEQCDHKGVPTMAIIETTKGFIFGGYTDTDWDRSSGWKSCPNAWLFALRGAKKTPMKIPVQNDSHAIYCAESFGPTFGGNYDLYVSTNSNLKPSCATSLGNSYMAPEDDPYYLLNGESFGKFQVEELEVFALQLPKY